jgi:hypothetical protein
MVEITKVKFEYKKRVKKNSVVILSLFLLLILVSIELVMIITKKDEINISETCTASPATIEEAFAKSDKAEVKIIPPGSNKPILKYNITKTKGFGDINSDETVSSSDASAILELYAKTATGIIESIDDKKMLICDINRDTSLDASDASIILDYYAASSTTATELNWDVFFSDYS